MTTKMQAQRRGGSNCNGAATATVTALRWSDWRSTSHASPPREQKRSAGTPVRGEAVKDGAPGHFVFWQRVRAKDSQL